jgi:four helix bundle protein
MTNAQMTKEIQSPNPMVYPLLDGQSFAFEERVFDLEERTAKFGESIIQFCKTVPMSPIATPLISQVVRSAGSVGANYCEADNAVSKKEFRLKIGTCQKEARETKHWLRMIAAAAPTHKEQARTLWQEARELHLIFSAILRKDKQE